MTKPKTTHFDTLSLHAGARPDPATGARATPIYQIGVVRLPRQRPRRGAVQHGARGARLFAHLQSDVRGARGAHRRARRRRRRDRDGERPGGAAPRDRRRCMGAGAHIVASRALYGGSHNLLDYTLPRFGIATTFVDPRDLDAWRAAIRPETRLLFGETLGNPGPRRARHPARRRARARARPAAARRFDVHDAVSACSRSTHGADLVFHSATKFLSGHGVVIGGAAGRLRAVRLGRAARRAASSRR